MRRSRVLKMLKSSKQRFVEFCDRCARVCGAGCCATAIREHAFARSFRWGIRV